MSKRKIETYFTKRSSGPPNPPAEFGQNPENGVTEGASVVSDAATAVQKLDHSPVKRQRRSPKKQDTNRPDNSEHLQNLSNGGNESNPGDQALNVSQSATIQGSQPAINKATQAFFQPRQKVANSLDPQQAQEQQQQLAQRLSDVAQRNLELAKEVVAIAEGEGRQPNLEDLLIEPSWREVLGTEFQKPYFKALNTFLQSEWSKPNVKVFPPKEMIFRAFNSCPFEDVHVLVLGQDPYHGPGQAMGLSFSVPPGVPIPSSLANMYKELKSDCGCFVPNHGNLEQWSHQGVFMLNAILTVRASEAASHRNKGWETFTDAAISALAKKRSGIVFMLWGNFAKEKKKLIPTSKHHVLEAAHPSGLSANKGFFGCKHFSKANKLLQDDGSLPVNWQIDRV